MPRWSLKSFPHMSNVLIFQVLSEPHHLLWESQDWISCAIFPSSILKTVSVPYLCYAHLLFNPITLDVLHLLDHFQFPRNNFNVIGEINSFILRANLCWCFITSSFCGLRCFVIVMIKPFEYPVGLPKSVIVTSKSLIFSLRHVSDIQNQISSSPR